MKKLLAVVLCVTMILSIFSLVPMSVSAQDIETAQVSDRWSGDYHYQILSDNTVEIIAYGGYDSDVDIPETIDGYTVTSIGETAFCEDIGIKSVTIPDTVKHIGDSAFYDCSGLESVNLGEGVTNIESNAFADCSSLKSISLPNSVTDLGGEVFGLCSALESVAFSDNLTSIPDGTFSFCTSLKEITIPDGIKRIGVGAFEGCSNLSKINCIDGTTNIIPDGVTDIGSMAFDNCTSLNNITIPSSVTNIGNWAFGFYQQETEKVDDFTITGHPKTAAQKYARDNGFKFISLDPMETYYYDVLEDGTAKITQYNGSDADVEIPDKLDEYTVTQIGEKAFQNNSSLESVTIPKSVESICSSAFMDCGGITSVTISDGVKSIGDRAFYGNTNLKSITIPKSVESIDELAFGYCWNGEDKKIDEFTICGETDTEAERYANDNGFTFELYIPYEYTVSKDGKVTITKYIGNETDVVIPSEIKSNPVTNIGEQAFVCCEDIESITIPDTVINIGKQAFSICTSLKSVTIPDSVEIINFYAFGFCDNLATVNIGKGVRIIGQGAFEGGLNLTSINIPDNVKIISTAAFYGCEKLESLTIGNGVETIGNNAFTQCSSLSNINFGSKVNHIPISAFTGCTSLTSINVVEENNYYCSADGVLFNKDKTELICYPDAKSDTSYNIPDTVNTIAESAFNNSLYLVDVNIQSNVETIGAAAFENCKKISAVTIPESVKSIEERTFSHCTSLSSLAILDGVESFADFAFYGCENIKSVTIPQSVTSIGKRAFGYDLLGRKIDDFTIYGEIGTEAERYANDNGFTFALSIPYEYTVSEDGNVTITKYIGSDTDVIIPSDIEGHPVTTIGEEAFSDNEILETITIPKSVTIIGKRAFYDCRSLADITIPDSVLSIGDNVFGRCVKLETVNIGKSVKSIGDMAFVYCSSLKEINVVEENESYSSSDGVLFNKDKTELHIYPRRKTATTYDIPDSVESISSMAYLYCTELTNINIPDSVQKIGSSAFYGCDSLSSITVPETVISIETKALGYNSDGNKIDDFTIYGVSNTEAERYANDNGFNFVTPVVQNFRASANEDGIRLEWDAYPFSNTSRYVIYVKDGENWKRYSSTANCSITYAIAEYGETYTFNIVAIDADKKEISNMYEDGLTFTYPEEVTFNMAASIDDHIRVQWNAYKDAAKYKVYLWDNDIEAWKKVTTVSTPAYNYKNVEDGKEYKFNVVPIDSEGKEIGVLAKDGISCTYTENPFPTTFTAKNVDAGIRLDWSKIDGASRYALYYQDGDKWTKISTTSNQALTFKKAEAGKTYKFSIRAIDANGNIITGYDKNGPEITR